MPAAQFYMDALRKSGSFCTQDFDNYCNYDVGLFPTYTSDLEEMLKAKEVNPGIITGIVDPRGSNIKSYIEQADFLVVDSLEMRDFFSSYGKSIFTYHEYPDISLGERIPRKENSKIIIGYHGNMVHLVSMYPEITTALERLADKYDIELWAIYNIEKLGKWTIGIPNNIHIRHIQWSPRVYQEHLSNVDIGIVPACMPVSRFAKRLSGINRLFNESPDDYLLRFKMPSSPGRLIVFWGLGIPVVADFLPSHLQFIQDGENGFIAKSAAGWYRALEKLILSSELRDHFKKNAYDSYKKNFDYSVQNRKLEQLFKSLTLKENYTKVVTQSTWGDEFKISNALIRQRLKTLISAASKKIFVPK